MSRPQSMPDFAALMDPSTSLFEKRIHTRRQTSPERKAGHIRKKPSSLSLAAGLIMNTEGPKLTGSLNSPIKPSCGWTIEEGDGEQREGKNLFYAYALRSDYPESPPYILTFASAAVCSRWWALVQHEYSESARPSPQFFIVRTEHMELIRDDPKFFDIRYKWFYTSQDSPTCPPIVIPLQSTNGHPAVPPQQPIEEKPTTSAIDSLTEKLEKLASVVETNVEQINALSVAQSAGLQHMQEINESNSTQIKAIADSQLKLQALVDQNASHYIALSNASFQSQEQTRHSLEQTRQTQEQTRKTQEQTRKSQEQTRDVLKTAVTQIQTLSQNQAQLAQACEGMMRGIENLSTSVSQMRPSTALSDTSSNQSSLSAADVNSLANRISPGPRKLNRRIKGVWYEYDNTPTPNASSKKAGNALDTPPKSPILFKNL